MFEIKLLPPFERGPDGERLGRITVGDFSERFVCSTSGVPVKDLPRIWKERLRSLARGASAVALVHDPRFAWIVYREGKHCFVQQRLSLDGQFEPIPPRVTVTDDGDSVSEWAVQFEAIERFVTT